MKIENVVFDFGAVLVDWNPRYLYKNYFANEEEMEFFLKNICTDEWNIEQDRGRPLAEATELLQRNFPEYYDLIAVFYGNWEKMIGGEIEGTVRLLYRLKEQYQLYGLTNWSAETIPIAFNRFSFFKEFEGIVVSGEEKLIKPDPKIYEVLLNRYHLKAENSLFIDDNLKNIKAADALGFKTIHFENPRQLEAEFLQIKVL